MNRPLVYFSIAIFMGCFCSLILKNNLLLGAVLAASFLTVFLFTQNKVNFILITAFFIIGAVNFNLYFNLEPKNSPINIRVIENKNFYGTGEYKGRKLLLQGKLQGIAEGQSAFVYGKFTRESDYGKGIIGVYKIDKVDSAKKDFISYFYSIKDEIYKKFDNSLGNEKSALIMALCFGQSKYLSQDQKNEFQKLGVVHAISVSGFHMAIIFKLLEKFAPFQAAIAVSLLYALFTGAASSTIRAFIMIFILKCARKFYRNYDPLSSLSLSAMILLLIKPYYILDLGFILSFLATLGIILYYRKIRRFFYFLPKSLNESISLTLSAQVFAMPYSLFTFNNFSLGFVLGNIILLPFYSAVVVLGNISLLFYKFGPIFNMLMVPLKFILDCTDGISLLLLKISPPMISFTYFDAVCMFAVYTCFVLIKHGYKKVMYVPIFILFIVIFQSYNFFPKIEYMASKEGDLILLRYRNKSILALNTNLNYVKEAAELKEKYKADSVITLSNDSFMLKLDNSMWIRLSEAYETSEENPGLTMEIYVKNKKDIEVIGEEKSVKVDDFRYYDIIEVPKKIDEDKAMPLQFNRLASFIIIFHRVYML